MKTKSVIWYLLALAVITIAAFVRCWDYGLINLDDYLYVTSRPEICNWAGWSTIRFALTDVEESIWMPLTWLSYVIDWSVFGHWFGGFHLHSILIHAVNCALVWQLLRMLFRSSECDGRWLNLACFLGALVWAVHPLRCESAVFVSSRKDVLSFLWEFLALIAWLKGSEANGKLRVFAYTALAFLFFVVGSCCKPSVMTFPVLCLILDILVVRKVIVPRYPVFVAFMLFLGWFAAWQQGVGATRDFALEPMFDRLLDASAAFGIYVRNTLWPQWLAPQCIKRWPDQPRFLVPGLMISAAWGLVLLKFCHGLWESREKAFRVTKCQDFPVVICLETDRQYLFAGLAWFAIAVAPMLGLANFGYHAFADRFTYIPAFGISILVVHFLLRIARTPKRKAAFAGTAILVGCLALATWRQVGYWKDDLTLFSHTLEVDGDDNAAAHGILANWYYEFRHDLPNAVRHFELAAKYDVSVIMGSFETCILSLCESGQAEKIPDMMKRYEARVVEIYGPEDANGIFSGDLELNAKYGSVRTVYRAAKLAWWLSDPETYGMAGDLVKEIEAQPHLDNDITWDYLKWKYYKAIGNAPKADGLYEKVVRNKNRFGYKQYRFLGKDAEISESSR